MTNIKKDYFEGITQNNMQNILIISYNFPVSKNM